MSLSGDSAGRLAFTTREPIGVVLAVSAFNHPLNLIVHQVGPAIAAGCPTIVKPAPDTPLSCLALVELLEPSGRITNPRKCLTDLRNREAKASTAMRLGIAMPHVRTAQAKDFVFGVAIVPEPGLWFDAIDDMPVRIFFPMVAPTYKDRYYRKVEKELAEAFLREPDDFEGGLREQLLACEEPGEVIYLLSSLLD